MIVSSTDARRGPLAAGEVAPKARSRGESGVTAVPPQSGGVSIGRRLRDWKTLAGFGVSAAIIVFFVMSTHIDPGVIWANIRAADVRYLLLGLLVYFGAFIFRGLRWRFLLRRAELDSGVQLPPLHGIIEIIYLSWFVNCIVPAKLGDGYRSYLLSKHTGANMERTLGTVVGERMADVLALAVLLSVSGLLIIGSLAGAGGNLQTILFMGVGLVAVMGLAIVALHVGSGPVLRRLPSRWRDFFVRFTESLLRTFRRDTQLPLYSLTCLIWGCEVLRIWLVMQGFHITGLSLGVIVFTALAGSLLSTIPFTPAGLGAVEGASVAILTAFGVSAGLAGAVAVVDRVINYWSNIPVGGLLYVVSRRK